MVYSQHYAVDMNARTRDSIFIVDLDSKTISTSVSGDIIWFADVHLELEPPSCSGTWHDHTAPSTNLQQSKENAKRGISKSKFTVDTFRRFLFGQTVLCHTGVAFVYNEEGRVKPNKKQADCQNHILNTSNCSFAKFWELNAMLRIYFLTGLYFPKFLY